MGFLFFQNDKIDLLSLNCTDLCIFY